MTATFKKITAKQTANLFKRIIDQNDQWVERGLITLYNRQTATERQCKGTVSDNGIGFSGADAEFGTSLAEWVLKGRKLSEKQMKYARRIVRKYSGQLVEEARSKGLTDDKIVALMVRYPEPEKALPECMVAANDVTGMLGDLLDSSATEQMKCNAIVAEIHPNEGDEDPEQNDGESFDFRF